MGGPEIAIRPGKVYHRSVIGYAQSRDGVRFERRPKPLIEPEHDWESLGCEDPRATMVDGLCYIFYTAVSPGPEGHLRVVVAGAVTEDFVRVRKLGPVNLAGAGRFKAAALFPERIGGRYGFLFTEDADRPGSTIRYASLGRVEEMFEGEPTRGEPLLIPSGGAFRGPELGAVPLRTDAGWLLVYCPESVRREWAIGAALLSIDDPRDVIAITRDPLLRPEEGYEKSGYVQDVAFPEGAVVVGDTLRVYYGGADSGVCLATCDLPPLLASLRRSARPGRPQV